MITAKTILLSLAACAVAGYFCVPLKPRDPASGAHPLVHIDIWQPWGGQIRDQFGQIVDAFNAAHPGIRVRPVFFPGGQANSGTKFFLAAAGGVPPDLTFVDGPQVTAWAELGLLEPAGRLLRPRARQRERLLAALLAAMRRTAATPGRLPSRPTRILPSSGTRPSSARPAWTRTPPRSTTAEVDADNERLTRFDATRVHAADRHDALGRLRRAEHRVHLGLAIRREVLRSRAEPRHRRRPGERRRAGMAQPDARTGTASSGSTLSARRRSVRARRTLSSRAASRWRPCTSAWCRKSPTTRRGWTSALRRCPRRRRANTGPVGWAAGRSRCRATPRHRRTPAQRAAALTFLKWACASPTQARRSWPGTSGSLPGL